MKTGREEDCAGAEVHNGHDDDDDDDDDNAS